MTLENKTLKCEWKKLSETKIRNPNGRLIYCRDKCDGYQKDKFCYYIVNGMGFR